MRKICAANWKLNFSPDEARRYFVEWSELVGTIQQAGQTPEQTAPLNCDVVFFTPAYDLPVAVEFAVKNGFQIGPQNIYFVNSGAFTGEISPQAVRALGAEVALIGHSERRTLFGETDEAAIAKKVKASMLADLMPILCVGESLAERESNQTKDIVGRQLRGGLELIIGDFAQSRRFAIAYEPVWAIGTGKVATPAQASEMHAEIRTELETLLGKKRAHEIPILYGGSVKPENARELASQANIDGFLVGGASLKPKDFLAIAATL